MRRRAWAAALGVLLLFQLSAPPVSAAADVYFVAASENVLALTDATMPFWSDGYLYIAASVFTGPSWQALDISSIQNNTRNLLILNSRSRALTLLFDLKGGGVQDPEGVAYTPGAIRRGGTVFVPAALVASFFGLDYTVTKVAHGYLIWLRRPGFVLSEKRFADAAVYSMEARYAVYLKEKEPETEQPSGGTSAGSQTSRAYLCMEAGTRTEALLRALDNAGQQAAFFCTPEFMEQNGDLLRHMAATGQAVGIQAEAGDGWAAAESRLEAGNRALWQAACMKTRLVQLSGASADTVKAAEAEGYRVLIPDVDRAGYRMSSDANADALVRRLSTYRGDAVVWLADTATDAGMRSFLTRARQAGRRCVALTETT